MPNSVCMAIAAEPPHRHSYLCHPPRPQLTPVPLLWAGLLRTLGQVHTDCPCSRCPLPGLRSCCHPACSSDHPHLCLPGAVAQIFWDQSDHLSRRDRTLPRPRRVRHGSLLRSQDSSLLPGASAAPPAPRPYSCALPVPVASQSSLPVPPIRLLNIPLTSGVFLSLFSVLHHWVGVGFLCCFPTGHKFCPYPLSPVP